MATNIVRTPQTYPLLTITRDESPALAQMFVDFLNNIETNARSRDQFIRSPELDIPDEFDGRRQWARFLSPIKNQGTCGGCYAFAACSALSDRYNIRAEGRIHLNLSAARIIQCDTVGKISDVIGVGFEAAREAAIKEATEVFGCHGNTLMEAWRYLNNLGTNTVECVPEYPIEKTCKEMTGEFYDTCEALSTPTKQVPAVFWRARHLYVVPGVARDGGSEHLIRKNIFRFGPISTAMDIYEDFYTFDPRREIYCGRGARVGGHAVVIDGWGAENGVDYWWVRNSWGKQWGIEGYFKLKRGSNCCNAESNIIVGAPIIDPIGTLDVSEQSVDLLNFPQVTAIRRALESTFTPYGGIDPRTNISRRQLSFLANQNAPETRIPDLRTPYSEFVAGHVNGKLGASRLVIYSLYIGLVIAVIVVLYFLLR